MPVVQKLTLCQTIGDVPKGTQILVVTNTKSDYSTHGILPALRRAGYTDDQFISDYFNELTDESNWNYQVMPEEDPGELNIKLAKFSQPIYTNHIFRGKNAVVNGTSAIDIQYNESILTGAYWDFWKRTLGNFFWLFFIILFILWFPFVILKYICWGIIKLPFVILRFIFAFVAWVFMIVLNICTFGLLDLNTDWDDFFDW